MSRSRSAIADARRIARRTERLLGAASAVQHGRAPQWVANQIIGRTIGRLTRKAYRR